MYNCQENSAFDNGPKMRKSERMSNELFTPEGKRKYLNAEELARFIAAAQQHERAEVRTFCLVLAHAGCQISEALALTVDSVDLSNGAITFKTLKQRDKIRHRAVPVPESTLDALELVHGLRKAQRGKRRKGGGKLWLWGRTQGYQHVKAVMEAAGVAGPQASPKGLRHGFRVRATDKTHNPRLVMKWLGHRSLDATIIYMDVIGQEEREAAAKMWG
jgi:integrase